VAVIEFGDKVRAEVLLSYGNATQPGSKFMGDQLEMLSEKKLRNALLTKAEVMDNLFERKVFK
jgi:acyl-homoserine-lactone acylase